MLLQWKGVAEEAGRGRQGPEDRQGQRRTFSVTAAPGRSSVRSEGRRGRGWRPGHPVGGRPRAAEAAGRRWWGRTSAGGKQGCLGAVSLWTAEERLSRRLCPGPPGEVHAVSCCPGGARTFWNLFLLLRGPRPPRLKAAPQLQQPVDPAPRPDPDPHTQQSPVPGSSQASATEAERTKLHDAPKPPARDRERVPRGVRAVRAGAGPGNRLCAGGSRYRCSAVLLMGWGPQTPARPRVGPGQVLGGGAGPNSQGSRCWPQGWRPRTTCPAVQGQRLARECSGSGGRPRGGWTARATQPRPEADSPPCWLRIPMVPPV